MNQISHNPKSSTLFRLFKWCFFFTVFLIAVSSLSLSVGTARLGLLKTLSGLLEPILGLKTSLSSLEETILYQIRLPRVLLTGIVGMALAVSGTVFQALLRNPLAEPFILGISSGAAVGALLATGIGLSFIPIGTPLAAFVGAAFTVALVFSIAGLRGRLQSNTILLTGVIVNAFFTAIIMTILSLVPDERVHRMLFWLYGDLTLVSYGEIFTTLPFVFIGIALIYLKARDMNIIVTGEDAALQLGIDVEATKRFLFIFATLITGVVVSASGIIGFVGLIVPHLIRMMIGSDHRFLVPLSALFGASFLILADTLARTVIAPSELPVGVVTAALGAPFFIFLLKTRGTRWGPS
jgi:iron complex transport system permease protein